MLCLKSGRSVEGAKAVSSHTGSLAGSDSVYDALLVQSGVQRVDTIAELFDYAELYTTQPLPRGPRVAIITNAGGPGIMATDAAIRNGLKLAELSEATKDKLRPSLPAAASLRNPVDVIGDARSDRYKAAVRTVLEDPGVDMGIVILTPQSMTDVEETAQVVPEAVKGINKPVVCSFMGARDVAAGAAILRKAGIPNYQFPEDGVRAMAAANRLVTLQEVPHRTMVDMSDCDVAGARKVIEAVMGDKDSHYMTQAECRPLFACYKLPLLKSGVACSADEAAKLAEEIGGPLAMKVIFYTNDIKLSDSQAIVLLDVDSNYSDFIVVHKGILRFSKNILIGANHLIDEKEAYTNKFIDEVGHSLKVFSEESDNIEIIKIYLSGAAKNIENLDKLVNARFNLPCEAVDLLKNALNIDREAAIRANTKFISLSPVLGLLAKYKEMEFDLMPNEKRIGQLMEEKRKNLTITGILFSAIILTLSILLVIHINNKNIYINELKHKIASIKNTSDEVDKMRLSIDLVHERVDASGDVLNLLNEVYKTIPKEVYLTSVDVENRGQVVLKGHAVAISDVFKFVTSLSTSPFLEKVKDTYATTKEENNNQYADFEIIAEYKASNGK